MNLIVKATIVLLLCFLMPSIVIAAPSVYPVREVFGFNAKSLPDKAPVFSKWVGIRGTTTLEKEFDAAFRKEFGPLAAENVTDVNKHEVLVASLHLIRASQYEVPKMGNYEVHLPITLSIVITNPSNGDAIYSFTKTSYASVLLASPSADTQEEKLLLEQTASNYAFLLQTLIKEVKQGYNPTKIEISVTKDWKGLYILDKGGKSGIARDDNLVDANGNEIAVMYVAEDYAIATSLLGKVDRGQKFFKYATANTASQFSKPRVLTMHEGWGNPDLTDISRFFESEVSKESAFTLLPVNEYFRKLLEAIARDTRSGKFETTQQRAVPDYMMKFSAAPPRFYSISEKGKFSLNVYEQYILGELLDKQGRIIFSAVGTNRIEDKNVGGMVFDKKARLEVLLKNAVVNLAEQFASSIKFSHLVSPVKKVSGKSIEVEDKSRELRIGQEVTLFRNIGRVDGIHSEVVIPLWQASVVDVEQGKVKLDLVLPMVDKGVGISEDDMVIVDAMTTAATAGQSETSVSYCTDGSPKLGSLDIDDFNIISRVSGYRLPYTLYDNDKGFREKIQAAIKEGGFKVSSFQLGGVDTAGRCLQPVYRAAVTNQLTGGKCSVSLAVGYRLFVRQERKGAAASETKLSLSDLQESVFDPTIQCEISKNAVRMLKDNIIKVRYQ